MSYIKLHGEPNRSIFKCFEMENLAPNLTNAERKQVIEYLQMSQDNRAHYLGRAMADPKISGALLRVLGYLLTA